MYPYLANPLRRSLHLGALLLGLLGAAQLAGADTSRIDNNSSANNSNANNSSAKIDNSAVAVFAGGCFWCTESDFDKVTGVISTISGYIGGQPQNATYEAVSSGKSGHIEAVQVRFDPSKTSYAKLLEAYWPSIDPLNGKGQFCDNGAQYLSAIFYNSPEQQQLAQATKAALDASGRLPAPIVTKILPATTFYPAEEYHQDYHSKNPLRYNYYRRGCGRDARLQTLWGAPAQ